MSANLPLLLIPNDQPEILTVIGGLAQARLRDAARPGKQGPSVQ